MNSFKVEGMVAPRTPCHHQEEEGQLWHLRGLLKVRNAWHYLEEVLIWPQVS